MLAQVTPAVVNISVIHALADGRQPAVRDPLFRRFSTFPIALRGESRARARA